MARKRKERPVVPHYIIDDIESPVDKRFDELEVGDFFLMYREVPRKSDGEVLYGLNHYKSVYVPEELRKGWSAYENELIGYLPFLYYKEETTRSRYDGTYRNSTRLAGGASHAYYREIPVKPVAYYAGYGVTRLRYTPDHVTVIPVPKDIVRQYIYSGVRESYGL